MSTESRTDDASTASASWAALPWNAHTPSAQQAAAALRRSYAAAGQYPYLENLERREAALQRWRGLAPDSGLF